MIRINLLPSKRKKALILPPSIIYGLIGLVAVIVVIIVFAYLFNKQIDRVRADVTKKEQKLSSLKVKLKEVGNYEKDNEEFRKKTDIIEQLKKNQVIPLRVLDEVSEMLPRGVWLTKLKDNSGMVSIEGYAFSNTDLVSYVQNLKKSRYFADVNLVESRQSELEKIAVYKFKLNFRVKT